MSGPSSSRMAAMAALVFAATLAAGPVLAEVEVLESSAPQISVGAKLDDAERVTLQPGETLRVLVLSDGSTKTLKGPYEGPIADYRERKRWWDRIIGGTGDDAPIGATRGLRQGP